MKSVLVIDDEKAILEAIDTILTDLGYAVTTHRDAEKGERAALSSDFDLILIDIIMPEKNGAEIVEAIMARKPEASILVITGYPSDPLVKRAVAAGAKGLIKKPFEIATIMDFLDRGE